jgi:hypothetical protein
VILLSHKLFATTPNVDARQRLAHATRNMNVLRLMGTQLAAYITQG